MTPLGDHGRRSSAAELADLAHALESTDDLEARLARVLDLLRKLVGYDSVVLLEMTANLEVRLLLRPERSAAERATLREPLVRLFRLVSDPEYDARATVADSAWRFHLAVPLVGNDQVRGLLFVARDDEPYDEEALRVLSIVAAQVASYLTAARRGAEVLHRSEEEFRLLVESVGDYAIFMLDPEGVIGTWNLGAERIKGYAADEIVGQHFSRFYTAEDVAAGKCGDELERAARLGRCQAEGWRVRKDGSRFWANVVITAVTDPRDGKLLGFSKVTGDLTERRAAEDQRIELSIAQEAVRVRDELISIASHELRTPLSTLRIQADGIMRALRKGTVDPARLVAQVDVVSAQVTRLERLVTALLDVSRIEAGRLRLELEQVDLSALVREVARTLADEFGRAGCTPIIDAEQPMVGAWDRGRIDQVVTNLMTNAAKYGAGKPIEIVVRDDHERVSLSVRDAGMGIAPENHVRIFGRFERAAEAKHIGGLGLGLWLTKQIVEAHAGTIRVASALGAGATFTVELPKLRPA